MNPWNETQRAKLSASMRAAWARKSPKARRIHGAAISAGHKLGRKRHPVLLEAGCFDRLQEAAKEQGITSSELAVRLLEICVNDCIVDAVLQRRMRRSSAP